MSVGCWAVTGLLHMVHCFIHLFHFALFLKLLDKYALRFSAKQPTRGSRRQKLKPLCDPSGLYTC